MNHSQEDIASNTMNLLSATSTWVLVRHQWLITKMRSILTGEISPSLCDLYQFDELTSHDLNLPETLHASFVNIKQRLESAWNNAINAHHPLSGLSIFDQLNQFQLQAHLFMQESKEINQELWREFTMRDPLTGALTRLTLKSNLAREIQRNKRHHNNCSIVLIDQNKFKKINDEWGHNVGDRVLMNTALVIQNNLRSGDKLFRYGGDEWLILMPNTNQEEAKTMLERIQKISDNFQHTTNNQIIFHSSFQYGLAECSPYDNVDDWIAAADNDLYLAKRLINMPLFNDEENSIQATEN